MPDDLQPPVIPTVPLVPKVDEHPISDADAKQFSGMGDYHLPVVKDSAVTEQVKPEPNAAVQPKVEMPVVGAPAVVDLEEKAKDMLKTLEPTKKKPRSRAATRMVLAAVLVVLMGAGGFVGMQLVDMNSEQRSQARRDDDGDICCSRWDIDHGNTQNCSQAPECSDDGGSGGGENCLPPPTEDGCNQVGATMCQGEGGSQTGYQCTCVNNQGTTNGGCPWVWTCGAYRPSVCEPAPEYDADTSCIGGATGCGTVCTRQGSCLKAVQANAQIQFNQYECEAGENVANGCQNSNPSQSFVGRQACIQPPPGFCGTIQLDAEGGCFISVNIPCDDNPPDEPPEEESSYQCVSLAKSVVAPKIGDAITFTCNGSATGTTINHYEYQYKVGVGAYTRMTSPTLTVSQIGVHTVQCRACTSADSTSCTSWGLAQ